uniref:Uncharacterized protein n=1 Tax=Stegastes partitus TaxID=144197 RepID=A0A3B4YZ43_9TELE
MFSGMRTEDRGDSGVLDAAALRQQRRLKQAIQFLHKDSADLLPLDGLKKLGTSKQGVSFTRKALHQTDTFIIYMYITGFCLGRELNVLIDTGCRLNLMSSLTVGRLGLKEYIEENKMEMDGVPFQRKLCIDGRIKELSLTIGQLRIMCSFAIVEYQCKCVIFWYSVLKSVIDTDKQMLVFGTTMREQVQFAKKPLNER